MDAIRQHTFGPPEVLTLEQVPDPVAGPGEVLVDAVAHGVHLLDASLRRGESGPPLPLPQLPTIPGREIAGTVSAVGPGVDGAWVGAPVAAHLGPVPDGGGYARRVAVGAEKLHALPHGPDGVPLDPADAIAMIGTGRMAVYVLDLAAVTAADVVVVTGAAGGLGTLFVQESLRVGARVLALAGSVARLEVLRELLSDAEASTRRAADERLTLIDYSADHWVTTARTVLGASPATLVLDGVGGDLGTAAAELLSDADTARLVAYGWASGTANRYTTWAQHERIEASFEVRYAVGPEAPPMGDQRPYQERALALAASGDWRVATYRVPFADAARAHRDLEERRTTGKVVLV